MSDSEKQAPAEEVEVAAENSSEEGKVKAKPKEGGESAEGEQEGDASKSEDSPPQDS